MSLSDQSPANGQSSPLRITPHPCPWSVELEPLQVAGEWFVQLRLFHPAGVAIVYLSPSDADNLARALGRASLEARSGLVLPTSSRPS